MKGENNSPPRSKKGGRKAAERKEGRESFQGEEGVSLRPEDDCRVQVLVSRETNMQPGKISLVLVFRIY